MEGLPYELLMIIYDYLPIKDKVRLFATCKHANTYAPRDILLHVGKFIYSILQIRKIKHTYRVRKKPDCELSVRTNVGNNHSWTSYEIYDGTRMIVRRHKNSDSYIRKSYTRNFELNRESSLKLPELYAVINDYSNVDAFKEILSLK